MIALLLAAALTAPDVVVISVDTLRADHLGVYGHPHATSPHIDAFAEKAQVYENAVCEIPLTGPSFTSMMTSRFPRETGTTRNGLRLPDEIPTVAEIFRDAGYETICVTSNWTLKRKLSGLDRGFDVYDDDFHKRRWGIIKAERDAEEVTGRVLKLLDQRDESRPLFAWFHYSDPHAPYKKHKGFRISSSGDWPGEKGANIKARYDSEIAYADHWIGKVLERLSLDNAFIVFLSDHGESLYEHDYLGHGRHVYQTGLHIPLVIGGPGVAAGRNARPVRGVDIGPTLLGLAGLEKTPGMRGLDIVREPPPLTRARVVETYGGAVPQLPGAKALMANKGPQGQAAFAGPWKVILAGDDLALFDLSEDRAEAHDLSAKLTDKVAELSALIESWSEAIARGAGVESTLTADDVEALESLGYID